MATPYVPIYGIGIKWNVQRKMSVIRNVFGGCVSDRSNESLRQQKLRFGATLDIFLKDGYLPLPLVEILVYIAKEGVMTVDLFRRPGNPRDTRRIVKRLTEGKPVIYANYNFHTLASVVKKFLLKIPGGVFGPEGEEILLQIQSLNHKIDQCQVVSEFVDTLPLAHQQLLSLLFGTWFRIVSHSEYNNMSAEALSRSIAGSMFHTCSDDPAKVERASRIMQLLIDNFGISTMFGEQNISFFTEVTHTGIHIREKFRYEYKYPPEEILPRDESLHWFVLLLQDEANKHGFDVTQDAITEEDFYEKTSADIHVDREVSESPERMSLCDEDVSMQVPPPLPKVPMSLPMDTQLVINVTTASAPEVSMLPSPEVAKRPKSLEDNLNEVRTLHQTKSLSRFNSVKRKQLERLRQRSDWFLGPNQPTNGQQLIVACDILNRQRSFRDHINGNSVTKSSSEGAVIDVIGSDADSVFEDTSRSESPASEPVRSHSLRGKRNIVNSDTFTELAIPDDFPDEISQREITDEDLTELDIRYFVVEHKYGGHDS